MIRSELSKELANIQGHLEERKRFEALDEEYQARWRTIFAELDAPRIMVRITQGVGKAEEAWWASLDNGQISAFQDTVGDDGSTPNPGPFLCTEDKLPARSYVYAIPPLLAELRRVLTDKVHTQTREIARYTEIIARIPQVQKTANKPKRK